MIKVLRIINRFNLGGPTYNAAYLTKYMPAHFQTLLIGGVHESHETDSLHIVKSLGIEPVLIPEMSRSINPYNDFIAYKKIRRIIKDFKPDIVHTHASKAGLLGRLAAIHENVKITVHTFHGHVFHSYFNPVITQTFIQIEKYLAKKTTKLIAISPLQKQELSEKFKIAPPEKFEIIPLGLDLKKFSENTDAKRQLFRQQHNIPQNVIAIGIVGRLAPIKNHHLLIDAVKVLKTLATQKFEILIIGDGELKAGLKEYIVQQGMTYRENASEHTADFYFTSWIKEMDIAYAGMDIVVLCSKNEGTPVSLIEAQASGKTIISTDVGGVRDIVHPDAGIIIQDFSAYTLAGAIYKHMQDFSESNEYIATHISPSIIEKYSYHTLAENMSKLYERLMSKKT